MNHSDDGKDLGTLLVHASRMLRHAYEQEIGNCGLDLTPGEIRALSCVAENEGRRQAELAIAMGIESMTFSAYVESLERQALVFRRTAHGDRRAKAVHVTPLGRVMLERIKPIVQAVDARAHAGLSRKQVEALRGALSTLRRNLDGDPVTGRDERIVEAPTEIAA